MGAEGPVADREVKERAFEAVLRSRTFARSEQLQAFLKYICELEIAGRGDEITEYSIATSALHRRADYAPGEDSSVRSRAHALRRKLQEYYTSEAAAETDLRVDLPKGSYRPRFYTAAEAPLLPVAPLAEAEPVRTGLRPFLYGALASALMAVLGIGVYLRVVHPDPVDPVVREAWGPLLASGSDVLIVVGSPPVARVLPSAQGILPRGNIMIPTPDVISGWYANYNLENRGGPTYMFPTRNYTVFSDTLSTAHVSALLSSVGVSFQAVPEVAFRPMAVHERGMVLIGSPAYTPFMARVLKVTPFSINYSRELNDEVIADGPPGAAKTKFVVKRNSVTSRFTTVYGLLTVLPAQPGRDRPQRTIVFSGIMGSPGAQAAVQYFTSPVAMRDLKERFRQQGHDTFPPAYQVVVRAGVDEDAAINSVYETHRVMSAVPVIE